MEMTNLGSDIEERSETHQDMMKWRKMFHKYDIDGDGQISPDEFKDLLKDEKFKDNLHCCAMQIMVEADEDKNGYLDIEEFLKMVKTKKFQYLLRASAHWYVIRSIPKRKILIEQGEYEKLYTCSPPPYFIIFISAVELLTYFIDLFIVGSTQDRWNLGPVASHLMFDTNKRNEFWRFITYMFVHIGPAHLVVNIIGQILLGMPLEMVHGWKRVMFVYLSGVLAGSLGTSIFDPKVLLAGASGGVYAILSAHIASIFMNWTEMKHIRYQITVFCILVGIDVTSAVINRYNKARPFKDLTGYHAHIWGIVAGILVGINVLRNIRQEKWEVVVWWISFFVYAVLMITAIIYNFFI